MCVTLLNAKLEAGLILTNSGPISISSIIYRSLGHIARLGPHTAAATESFGTVAHTVESTQIDQPAGE